MCHPLHGCAARSQGERLPRARKPPCRVCLPMSARPRPTPDAALAISVAIATSDAERRAAAREIAAASLELKAAECGDNTLRHCAAILRGARSPGRPRKDVGALVEEILQRFAGGEDQRYVIGFIAARECRGTSERPSSLARLLRARIAEIKRTK